MKIINCPQLGLARMEVPPSTRECDEVFRADDEYEWQQREHALVMERDLLRRERDEAVALLRDWVRDSQAIGGNVSVGALNFLARIDKKEK